MKLSEVVLPSNRKFGIFFTIVFALFAVYFFLNGPMKFVYPFCVLAFSFILITAVKADILLPLNKLWMSFGLLLGMIVSPFVLGLIFFGLFTTIALLMRLYGRDELRLRFNNKKSNWISRREPVRKDFFKNQF